MENPITKIDAVKALYGRDSYDQCDGNGNVKWKDGHTTTSAVEKAISDKETELKAEWESQAYARARKPLYPDIGDQLDDLYKKGAFSTEMAAKIKKVKDDNPKG